MTTPFLSRLCHLITTTEPMVHEALPYVRAAFEDTLAVACAGWAEPVTRKVAENYAGGAELTPLEPGAVEGEAAAMIFGTAIHALDFDDVHLASTSHPSVPIVAALTAAIGAEPELGHRLRTAFAVGIATNVELGKVLGFAHYEKGWHATSTIGPLAAAAALSHLYGLDAETSAHALALAAAQSGGLQRNFGSMAKPLHAGLAGAAGLRAARLARAGLTGDADIFAEKGFFDLYRGESLAADPDKVEFDLFGGGIAVKLYPCCYNNHRNIPLAFQAREALRGQGVAPEQIGRVEVEAPYGSFMALRVHDAPRVGSEGKFCGPYVVACALVDGEVGLSHFEDDRVTRPEVVSLLERVTLAERDKGGNESKHDGPVSLSVFGRDGSLLTRQERTAFPGAPDDPATPEQMEAKVRDCVNYYSRNTGHRLDYDSFQGFVDSLFLGAPHSRVGHAVQMALGDD